MPSDIVRVLLVEDSPHEADLLCEVFSESKSPQFEIVQAGRLSAALERITQDPWDVVLLDLGLPDSSGLKSLAALNEKAPQVPIVVLTGLQDEEIALAALRAGAQDYLVKGQVDMRLLVRTLRYAMERSQSETGRRVSEARTKAIIDSTLDAVITIDAGGHVLEFNPAAERMFGYRAGQVVGQLLSDLIVPLAYREAHTQALGRTRAERQNSRVLGKLIELPALRADGSQFPIELTVVEVASGPRILFTAFIRDITERKRAEAEHDRLTKDRLLLLESTSEGIYGMDNQKGVTFVNPAAAAMLGYAPEELIGKEMHSLIHHKRKDGQPYPAEECPVYRVYQTKERCHVMDEVFWRKDGSSFPVEYRANPLVEGGIIRGVVVTFSDTTEKKRFESQMLRSQRLESIGTLAGGIAHDLNNILAPILMAGQVLRMQEHSPEQDTLLATIESSAQRGAGIVKQILTFARGIDGDRVAIPLRHLINDMMKIVTETFPKNITVTRDYPKEVWPILGDPTQIQQILLNLCVNARDAMPQGGKLQIKLRNESVDTTAAEMMPGSKPGDYVCLQITDSGVGISKENLERIFDPFFTTKKTGEGSGLGLSIVAGIVKSHQGFMYVYSEVGAGTTFRIYLPASFESMPEARPVQPAQVPLGRGEVILVVDDEENIRQMTQTILRSHGYHVMTATDGADAIATYALNKKEIAAVLTDLTMPFMDGLALIRALRKMNPALPILASTGAGSGDLVQSKESELGALQVRGVLQKPYRTEALLAALHQLMLTHKDPKEWMPPPSG